MILALAMLLDAMLGEPKWLWDRAPHPAVLMGRAVSWLEKQLNSGSSRRLKGTFAQVILVLSAFVIGTALSALGPVVEIIATAILLAQKSLVEHVLAVAKGLRRSLPEGRAAVAMIVSRDTAEMDETAAARAAIESAAENLSDGVVAPAFWFFIAGLPGILIYKITNTADSTVGYRTPRFEQYGWAAARLDDVLNLIPASPPSSSPCSTASCRAGAPSWPTPAATNPRTQAGPKPPWPARSMSPSQAPAPITGKPKPFPMCTPKAAKSSTPRISKPPHASSGTSGPLSFSSQSLHICSSESCALKRS
jgi:adenosylcobinamide-phosphate synthase